MTFLKRELDAVEIELARVRAVGGQMVAVTAEEAIGLVAAFRAAWPGRQPVVIITGIPNADGGTDA